MSEQEEYLGDGLYASFDGGLFCLRAPRENGDHVVYFDAMMLKQLNEFARSMLRPSPQETARD
jgi:hypothetical protein